MPTLYTSNVARDSGYYRKKERYESEHRGGRQMTNAEFDAVGYVGQDSRTHGVSDNGTSVFDPVLCELMYSWFSAPGDAVLDPFAGGSVRGVVASKMGRSYTGVELREEQVRADIEQGAALCDVQPRWICGDSMDIDSLASGRYDLILTCPPYADLEVYSDDPADISNMPFDEFESHMRAIISKSVAMLDDDRFAVVVIGDARGKDGNLRNIPGHIADMMIDAGAALYNDIILVTPVGSLPIRVGRAFKATRKVGTTHQRVLVFLKGDAHRATDRLGEPDMVDLSEYEDGGER